MQKRFRYSLEALLRKRNWDLDGLRHEEREAYTVLEAKHKSCAEIEAQKAEIEAEIRRAYAKSMEIQPELYTALREFLNDKRDALSLAYGSLDEAKEAHEKIMHRVLAAKRSVRTLERHRESKEAEHRAGQQREAIRESDELWLLCRGVAGDE